MDSFIFVLSVVVVIYIASFVGTALNRWQDREKLKIPKETNAEAARRRAQERASLPKKPQYQPATSTFVPESVQTRPAPQQAVEPLPASESEPYVIRGKALLARLTALDPDRGKPAAPKPAQPTAVASNSPFCGVRRFETLTNITLHIRYQDARGESTRRTIDVKEYEHDWDGCTIQAYCYMRGGRRTFKAKRIEDAIDASTGEVIGNLAFWLDARYEASGAGAVDAFEDEQGAALLALFYVAKADGTFRAPEKRVLQELCDEWGLCDPMHCDLLITRMTQWATPSAIAYGKALREVSLMSEDYQQQVYDAAQRMVGSKKTVRDAETRALARMRKELDLPNP